jgi:branched-subunit amino acid transport protein AzlD
MTVASLVTDFWDRISEHELQGLYLVLVGFVGSFAFIRMSTRLQRSDRVAWWPGSIVSDSGVHLHHLVFGIVTMMVAGAGGFAAFGNSPWTEICALAFGVGAGLTIDEFALWVYLDDVYWAKEGRSSIDATVIATALMLLALLGFTPFTIEDGSISAILGTVLSALIIIVLVAICFAKGRIVHGSLGFFLFPIALYGACRLGKPSSAWARRRYGERSPEKQRRAVDRFPPDRRTERFKEALRDIVGGKPSEGIAAAREEAFAATKEAGEEVRERAERVTNPGDRGDGD